MNNLNYYKTKQHNWMYLSSKKEIKRKKIILSEKCQINNVNHIFNLYLTRPFYFNLIFLFKSNHFSINKKRTIQGFQFAIFITVIFLSSLSYSNSNTLHLPFTLHPTFESKLSLFLSPSPEFFILEKKNEAKVQQHRFQWVLGKHFF